MSAKSKTAAAKPASTPPPVHVSAGDAPAEEVPFYQRHPKIANAIFAALCVYVAMLWLLALDQTFHWCLFGPKLPPTP